MVYTPFYTPGEAERIMYALKIFPLFKSQSYFLLKCPLSLSLSLSLLLSAKQFLRTKLDREKVSQSVLIRNNID